MDTVSLQENNILLSDLEDSLHNHIRYTRGKNLNRATKQDILHSLALAVRKCIVDSMLKTEQRYIERDVKRLYYLSMEFLVGRSLENNLNNLGIHSTCREILLRMDIDPGSIFETEPDPGLGNGGLGRLAACFMDSLASLGMPGFGYGINYKFGLFKQIIENGYQIERPDQWLSHESPWLIERSEESCIVPLYGHVEKGKDRNGNYGQIWKDWKFIVGIPYDLPVVGYGGETVNCLRLFSARSSSEFDIEIFNRGDYMKAVEQKIRSELISRVLYPSDSIDKGKELRLIQEYFLVACSLRDIVRKYMTTNERMGAFPSKVAIQLNDTHPAIAVAELMRILVDERNLHWHKAWQITTSTLCYTNHTLLPEALEKWPVPIMERVLPRHLNIIYQINDMFLKKVEKKWPGRDDKLRRMSIIDENGSKCVRMANLSIIGSRSVNGVAELHTELLKEYVVPDFYELWPYKFSNKTNGISQRRWLLNANPGLSSLITEKTGDGWIKDLYNLKELESYAQNEDFRNRFHNVKIENKERLACMISRTCGISVNPYSMFDVQIKRIHEYKRQLLNVMHIIHEYLSIVEDGEVPDIQKTYIFAGKAAPDYWEAKQIIKLINNVGKVINNDARVYDLLKVVFIPDYKVSHAEKIIPAADLSEQISTAGKEASGTGNMKFALNGALTIGTLDGANIEIREEVGYENIFIFGLTSSEIEEMKRTGTYDPYHHYRNNEFVRRVMDTFRSDMFCPEEHGIFRWIYHSILEGGDSYYHLADLQSYIDIHKVAKREFRNTDQWLKKSILNVARIGKFSSDRTIRQYAGEIWGIEPVTD